MTILYIEGADAAQTLSSANGEAVVKFQPNTTLSGDISNITLVAYTRDNATTIGGRTPDELADDFAAMIPARKRRTVEHIYLIADEAGMPKHGELSLAQRFVEAMAEQGFNNLHVHAVTSPGVPILGMGVEIVAQRNRVVRINAFYPKDQYSCNVDREIFAVLDNMASSQKRVDALIAKGRLTQQEEREKRAEERNVNQKKNEHKRLILKRNKNRRYQRADILSTEDYKTAMQQTCNTFTAQNAEPVMSAPVSYAIGYLSSQRRHTDFVDTDIQILRENPLWDIEEIIDALSAHEGKPKNEGRYYVATVVPLAQALRQQDFSMLQPLAEPVRRVAGDGVALRVHGFFGAAAQPPTELTLREKLEGYKALREGEWWGFHYNFLGVMSVVYFISDCLCGTDYFNSKHREVKKSATAKLLNGAGSAEFTPHELSALGEGRLGKIVADNGGLEAVIAKLQPPVVPVVDDALEFDPEEDPLAPFSAPDRAHDLDSFAM